MTGTLPMTSTPRMAGALRPTGIWRMTVAATKHLVRGRDIIVAALVVPLVVLGVLTLFADLDFATGERSIGFTELMVTGAGVMMVAVGNNHAFVSEIATYKATGVLKRLAVTPISPAAVIIGQVVPRLTIGVALSLGYLVVAAALGVEITLGAQAVGVGLVLVMIAATLQTWGFFVAGFTRSPMNANALDTFAMFWLFLLNGAMFPLDAFPSWLERVAEYLPTTGLIEAIRGLTVHSQGLTGFGPQLLVGVAWMAILAVAAARTYRFTS
ncbi:ABC transporter permease [Myceligenerans halotolerans]